MYPCISGEGGNFGKNSVDVYLCSCGGGNPGFGKGLHRTLKIHSSLPLRHSSRAAAAPWLQFVNFPR